MKHNSFLRTTVCVVVFLSFFVSLFFKPQPAAASCIKPGNPDFEFAKATAVFSGKVIHVAYLNGFLMDFVNAAMRRVGFHSRDYYVHIFRGRRVTFEVAKSWKGVETSTIQIRTGYGNGDLGYPFAVGQDYLVYVHRAYGKPDGYLLTSVCTRTAELSLATADLAYLNTLPTLPLKFVPPITTIASAAFFVLITLLAGFVYIRRRRKNLAGANAVERN